MSQHRGSEDSLALKTDGLQRQVDGPACRAAERELSPQQQLSLLQQGSSKGKERLHFLVRWCLQGPGRWQPKRGPPQSPASLSRQGLGSASIARLPMPQEPPDPPGAESPFSPGRRGGLAGLDQLRISGPRSHRERTAVKPNTPAQNQRQRAAMSRGRHRLWGPRSQQIRKSPDRRRGRGWRGWGGGYRLQAVWKVLAHTRNLL